VRASRLRPAPRGGSENQIDVDVVVDPRPETAVVYEREPLTNCGVMRCAAYAASDEQRDSLVLGCVGVMKRKIAVNIGAPVRADC